APILCPDCEDEGSQSRTARLIEWLGELVVASGLEPRLRDHGIARDDIPMLAREAMKQQRLLVNNPCPIEEEDAARLYEAAW
ncbi:MAG: iron-containing alcohol dehydrogenase, partial [Sphingomonadaceae bacterium]